MAVYARPKLDENVSSAKQTDAFDCCLSGEQFLFFIVMKCFGFTGLGEMRQHDNVGVMTRDLGIMTSMENKYVTLFKKKVCRLI